MGTMPRPLRYQGRLNRRARKRIKALYKSAGVTVLDMAQGSVGRTLRELLLRAHGDRYLDAIPFAGPRFRDLYRSLRR